MSRSTDSRGETADTAELCEALQEAMGGDRRTIVGLERRPSIYRSSYELEEIDVRLDDGTTLQLMFKDLGRDSLREDARRAKPAFLHDPSREIEVYRSFLPALGLGTARCHGAVCDEGIGRHWLFLERVPGRELYQVGDLATWREAARWLAALHGRSARAAEVDRVPWLRHDRDYYWRWMRRAVSFLDGAGPARSAADRRRIERLAGRYDGVIDRLTDLPTTCIHGEFYASNVLVQATPEWIRVCPIDWEMAARGPGLIDLAALTAGGWSDDDRADLAGAYHAALDPDDAPASFEALFEALDYCGLHLAVQWLGWSPDWSPPPQHAHDWSGEIERIGSRVGL